MIVDANELPDGHRLDVDLCIVGAGAAGIAIALALLETRLNVLVLESGGERAEADTQRLYEGTVADERIHSPLDRYRQRSFGGSTTIWGGRCAPFDPIDFEHRPYMPLSGWPIEFADVAPFYPEANRICEAGAFAYTVDAAFDRPTRPMIEGFESSHFSTDHIERFSCPTDFGLRYGHKLRAAEHTRVLLHANVTALHPTDDGSSVAAARIATLTGKRFGVSARRFVLAAGGLEVTRLLLASRQRERAGIGNRYDVVGRYYMCHLAGTIGTLVFDDRANRVWHGYEVADDGTYCRRRIALRAATQRAMGVGNFVARLHHPRITEPDHRSGPLSLINFAGMLVPYEYGRRLESGARRSLANWLGHARNLVTDSVATAHFLRHWLRYRTFAERKFPSIIVRSPTNRYSLDFHAEQAPNADSRVTLARTVDPLGVPRLHVDWRYDAFDLATVHRSLALFADEIARSGTGQFEYDPSLVEAEMTRFGAYGGHHIGTTRMGTDPRTSVVDADCRVHGLDNLFIASASVFSTSSQANPTLTVVALALRLAAHLRARRPGLLPVVAMPHGELRTTAERVP